MSIPRTPNKTALHHVVRLNYRQVFFDKEIQGNHLPFLLEREFKKYLTCGVMEFGMARFIVRVLKGGPHGEFIWRRGMRLIHAMTQ